MHATCAEDLAHLQAGPAASHVPCSMLYATCRVREVRDVSRVMLHVVRQVCVACQAYGVCCMTHRVREAVDDLWLLREAVGAVRRARAAGRFVVFESPSGATSHDIRAAPQNGLRGCDATCPVAAAGMDGGMGWGYQGCFGARREGWHALANAFSPTSTMLRCGYLRLLLLALTVLAGHTLTKAVTLTMRLTLSRSPSSCFSVAQMLSATSLAAAYPYEHANRKTDATRRTIARHSQLLEALNARLS